MVSGELGKGVILTQSSKYSFDDNLGLEEDCDGSDFYDLFKDDKAYVYYDDSGFVNKGEIVWFVNYTKENMLT